jgi:hypothetical protein
MEKKQHVPQCHEVCWLGIAVVIGLRVWRSGAVLGAGLRYLGNSTRNHVSTPSLKYTHTDAANQQAESTKPPRLYHLSFCDRRCREDWIICHCLPERTKQYLDSQRGQYIPPIETSSRVRHWSAYRYKYQSNQVEVWGDRLTTFNHAICVLGTHIA